MADMAGLRLQAMAHGVVGTLQRAGKRFHTQHLIGGLTVNEIIKESGMNEASVVVALDHLIRRGGVMRGFVDGGKRTTHVVFYLRPGNWPQEREPA